MSQKNYRKPSFQKHHQTRSTKRNQELDKNRGEILGDPTVDILPRRKSRDSLRGRKDSTVLPLSNTPLYGIDDPEPRDIDYTIMAQEQLDINNFNTGNGDTNANEIVSTMDIATSSMPLRNNVNSNTGATRKQNSQIPSTFHLPPYLEAASNHSMTNTLSGLDPATAHHVKELVINVQKETMAEMMKNLTDVFKETLRLETENILKGVTSNNNNNSNYNSHRRNSNVEISNNVNPFNIPTTNARPGDRSIFRLGYREPRAHQNPSQHQPQNNAQPQHHQHNRSQVNSQNNSQNFHHQPYNYYPQRALVQLDKWGLTFNGTNMHVEDFLYRVELKQSSSNYTWAEIYDNFNTILTQPAEEFWWDFRKKYPQADYRSFKIALAERFPPKYSDIDLWRKLINRKQKSGESFDELVDDMERIYYQMVDPPTNQQLISVIRDNVSPDISAYIGLNRTDSIVALKYMAREAEKLVLKLHAGQRSKPFYRYVSEVSEPESCKNAEDHVFVEAFNCQRKEYKVFQCKRCSQKFRVDEESKEEKRIYCYGCGKDGVIKSNCPKCSENRVVSE